MIVLLALFRPFSTLHSHRFSRFVCPVANWILGAQVTLRNGEQLTRSQPCIFIFNHQSILDAFLIGFAIPGGTVAIGKKSLRWIPIFGWLFYLSGSLLIDRKNRRRAMETMTQAKEKLKRERLSVLIAPEGTRSGKQPMGPFKKGAFYLAVETGLPLQPVVASSFQRTLNYWKWRSGTVIVEALEPIPSAGTTSDDIEGLMDLAHERMRLAIERLDHEVSESRHPR